MIRLFIAFPIDSAIRQQLAALCRPLKPLASSVKWVEPKNMHFTARFLGETDPLSVPSLIEAVKSTCLKFGPVQTSIDRLGAFPNLKRPQVFWAGLSESAQGLMSIVIQLNEDLKALGIDLDSKRFKPHLTLGRIKRSRDNHGLERLIEAMDQIELEPIPIILDRLELIQSTLTPRGPIYKTLGEGKLAERFI